MLIGARTAAWSGKKGVLPEGCRRVQYLESTGTQWCTLNRSLSLNSRVVCRCAYNNNSSLYRPIFGNYNEGQIANLMVQRRWNNSISCYAQEYLGSRAHSEIEIPFDENFHVYDLKKGVAIIDGANPRYTDLIGEENNKELVIFAYSGYGHIADKAKGKIDYIKIYEHNEIVVDAVSVAKSVNGTDTGFLYDFQNDVFYSSEDGAFIIGPDI